MFLCILKNIYLFGCAGSQLQHMGSSSLTRDQIRAPCIGITVLATGPPGKSLSVYFVLPSVLIPVSFSISVSLDMKNNCGAVRLALWSAVNRFFLPLGLGWERMREDRTQCPCCSQASLVPSAAASEPDLSQPHRHVSRQTGSGQSWSAAGGPCQWARSLSLPLLWPSSSFHS